MSKSESGAATVEKHYECTHCGYTAPVDVGIGLCPTCREAIPVKPGLQ
jgi:rubrerythrin